MSIGWPEVILLALLFLGMGDAIASDGEMEERSAFSNILGVIILLLLLWWGDFFA